MAAFQPRLRVFTTTDFDDATTVGVGSCIVQYAEMPISQPKRDAVHLSHVRLAARFLERSFFQNRSDASASNLR